DLPLAIASSFKLYVLGELARQIASGEAQWDEPLTLRDALKSLPSGNLLYWPDGSVLPLQYYAERMIAESDNTATDHLIHRLGRRNVEAMMVAMAHAEPERNRPLLLTREWFAIKLRLRPEDVRRYLAAGETEKRDMLRHEIDPLADTLWDGETWTGPYLIDTIEWFASASDLCRAMASLHEMASQPGLAPVAGALSLEPGIV
ncbi:MAG: serine hydrolase, partial [Chloroflexota bacterium]